MLAVTLRTGTEALDVLVRTTLLALGKVLETDPVAFLELVSLCRDPEHEMWGNSEEVLLGFHLMDGPGHVHQSVREIVLAATEGEGRYLHLVNPLA